MSGKISGFIQREAKIIGNQLDIRKEVAIIGRQFNASFLSKERLDDAGVSFANFRAKFANVDSVKRFTPNPGSFNYGVTEDNLIAAGHTAVPAHGDIEVILS